MRDRLTDIRRRSSRSSVPPALARLLLGVTMLTAPASAAAQSISAPKAGERTAGQSKICVYAVQGVEYTRTLDALAVCPIAIRVRASAGQAGGTRAPEAPKAPAKPATMIVVKTGEQVVGGTVRCFYDGDGRTFTRTVKQNQPCPPSITVEVPDRR